VDELDRAHVDTARRLGGEEELEAAELARDDDLLLVAAGERTRRLAGALRADVELGDALLGEVVEDAAPNGPPAGETGVVGAVEDEVLGDREPPTRPSSPRSSGTKPTPLARTWLTLRPTSSAPSRLIDPVVCELQTHDRLGELGLAVALHAGDGEDLAGTHVEADVVDDDDAVGADDAKVLTSRPPADVRGFLCTVSSTGRPTIIEASSVLDAVGSASPTTLPRRMTVMRSATARTSRSLCVMKTIAVPSSRSCA
jgi:hypothetical protein